MHQWSVNYSEKYPASQCQMVKQAFPDCNPLQNVITSGLVQGSLAPSYKITPRLLPNLMGSIYCLKLWGLQLERAFWSQDFKENQYHSAGVGLRFMSWAMCPPGAGFAKTSLTAWRSSCKLHCQNGQWH